MRRGVVVVVLVLLLLSACAGCDNGAVGTPVPLTPFVRVPTATAHP